MQCANCREGHYRCPVHAFEYAVTTMEKKGWGIVPEDYEKDLKELGVRLLEWIGAGESAQPGMYPRKYGKAFYSNKTAILLAANPAPWNVRRWFLRYFELTTAPVVIGAAAQDKEAEVEMLAALIAASKLGGPEAVAEMLESLWGELGVATARAMGGDS